jgi:hypothetical protein
VRPVSVFVQGVVLAPEGLLTTRGCQVSAL